MLGAFLAGLLLLGGHAWADSNDDLSGNVVGTSALNGSPTVQADVCGNAVGVGGDPQASCGGDQETTTSGGGGTEPPGGGVVEEPPGGGTEPPDGGPVPDDGGGSEPPTGGGTEPPEGGVLPPTLGGDETPAPFTTGGVGSAAVFGIGTGSGPALAFTGDHLEAFALLGLVLILLGTALFVFGQRSAESEVI